MKVLVCDPMSEKALEALKGLGLEVTVKTGMSPEELEKTIPVFDVMIVRSATKVRKPIIDAARRLKLIIRGGVGLDNIDVAYAEAKGIQVRNTPNASSNSVAELAVGMMFCLARSIHDAHISMKKHAWEKKKFKGIELAGKTLGLIGFGRIGKATAKIALGLGMKILYFRKSMKPVPMENTTLVPLDTLLEQSDFISLHMPYDPETCPILDPEAFAKMKDGVFIINCSRGGVVDEGALLDALESGKVAGAGMDVYAKEPTDNWALVDHPKVLLTPHIGAQTKEGQGRVGDEIVKILKAFT